MPAAPTAPSGIAGARRLGPRSFAASGVATAFARRTGPGRRGRSSRLPRSRPRSRPSSPSRAPARGRASPSAAAPTARGGPRRSAVRPPARSTSRPTVMSPRTSRRASPPSTARPPRQPLGLEAGLGRVAVHVDLEEDRDAARPGEPRARAGRGARRGPRSRPSGSTSKASSARFALFDWSGPTRCHVAPVTAAALASPSWTRFSPSVVRPAATAARTRSTVTVLLTATRVTPPGSRPARAQASAIRPRTRSRAARSSSIGGRDRSCQRRRRPRPPRLLAAEEARDLQVVRVVGGRPLGRRRLADGPLDPRWGHDGGGGLVVVAVVRAVAGLQALALELLEEVPLTRCPDRRARRPPAGPPGRAGRSRACGCRRSRSR